MNKDSKIYVAGHCGLVGSAIVRILNEKGYTNIVGKSSQELDLREKSAVELFLDTEKPELVFLAAAKVGGIMANTTQKSDFFYDNILISTNVIHGCWKTGIKKLINLGSSCIYPKMAPQPLKEDSLLTGPLEPTNDAYALAKISAIKMCTYYNQDRGTDYISAMPTNVFGINDNFNLKTSHVLPALIRKFHAAKTEGTDVTLWGDGSPYREFIFADDLADALVFLSENCSAADTGELINIGTGKDLQIKDLANLIAQIVGYTGKIHWDITKPNGTPRKLLDVSRLSKLGWNAPDNLKAKIKQTYAWFLEHQDDFRDKE